MTNKVGQTGTRLLLAAGAVLGLGLTGCGPAATTSSGTAGGNVGTGASSSRVASTTIKPQPGVGKGRWVVESAPATGTFVRRRVWVPDDGSEAVTTPGISDSRRALVRGVNESTPVGR